MSEKTASTIELPVLPIQFRQIENAKLAVLQEDRTVRMIASDETPVMRWDWENWQEYMLVLSHDEKHVDLSRVKSKVCLFFEGHPNSFMGGKRLGKIMSADLNGKRLEIEIKLNRSVESNRYLEDIADGVEPGNSVGVNIRKMEVLKKAKYETDEETGEKKLLQPAVMKAVDWELVEVSAVDIPANPNANSNLSSEQREALNKLPRHTVQILGDPGYEVLSAPDSTPVPVPEEAIMPTEPKLIEAVESLDLTPYTDQIATLTAERDALKAKVDELTPKTAPVPTAEELAFRERTRQLEATIAYQESLSLRSEISAHLEKLAEKITPGLKAELSVEYSERSYNPETAQFSESTVNGKFTIAEFMSRVATGETDRADYEGFKHWLSLLPDQISLSQESVVPSGEAVLPSLDRPSGGNFSQESLERHDKIMAAAIQLAQQRGVSPEACYVEAMGALIEKGLIEAY